MSYFSSIYQAGMSACQAGLQTASEYYNDYAYPVKADVTNASAEVLEKCIPKTLMDSGLVNQRQVNKYLLYSPRETDTDQHLERVCDKILKSDVSIAVIPFCCRSTRNHRLVRCQFKLPSAVIAKLLGDPRCKLQYLDLSTSKLMVGELIEILNGLSANSELRCIHIGTNLWGKDDFTRLVNFLKHCATPMRTMILGLHGTMQKLGNEVQPLEQLFNEDTEFAQADEYLDQYNKTINSHVNLDATSMHDHVRKPLSQLVVEH